MSEHTTDFLASWLEQLNDEEIQREIRELEVKIADLSVQINTRREALDLKRRFREVYEPQTIPRFRPGNIMATSTVSGATARASIPTGPASPANSSPAGATGPSTLSPITKPRSIPESVVRLMEADEGREDWPVVEIEKGLIGRAWLEDTSQARRSLGSALSRMLQEGLLVRPRRAVYGLAVSRDQTAFDVAPSGSG